MLGSMGDIVNIAVYCQSWDDNRKISLANFLEKTNFKPKFKLTTEVEIDALSEYAAHLLYHPAHFQRMDLYDGPDAVYKKFLDNFRIDEHILVVVLTEIPKHKLENYYMQDLQCHQPTVFKKARAVIACSSVETMDERDRETILTSLGYNKRESIGSNVLRLITFCLGIFLFGTSLACFNMDCQLYVSTTALIISLVLTGITICYMFGMEKSPLVDVIVSLLTLGAGAAGMYGVTQMETLKPDLPIILAFVEGSLSFCAFFTFGMERLLTNFEERR